MIQAIFPISSRTLFCDSRSFRLNSNRARFHSSKAQRDSNGFLFQVGLNFIQLGPNLIQVRPNMNHLVSDFIPGPISFISLPISSRTQFHSIRPDLIQVGPNLIHVRPKLIQWYINLSFPCCNNRIFLMIYFGFNYSECGGRCSRIECSTAVEAVGTERAQTTRHSSPSSNSNSSIISNFKRLFTCRPPGRLFQQPPRHSITRFLALLHPHGTLLISIFNPFSIAVKSWR